MGRTGESANRRRAYGRTPFRAGGAPPAPRGTAGVRRRMPAAVLFLILVVPAAKAIADHPAGGFGPGRAGPIVTVPATTLPKGERVVALRTEYTRFDRVSDENLTQAAAAGEDAHSLDSLTSPFLGTAYGVTDDLTLSLNLPYVIRSDIRAGRLEGGVPEVDAEGDSAGIGDATFLAQYRFSGGPDLEASVLAGVKIPTGKTNERTSGGERFETEHQPGSGSWDPIGGLAVTKRLGGWSLDGNLLYTLAGKGSQATRLGNLLQVNVSVSRRLGGEEPHGHAHEREPIPMHGPHHSHAAWDLILEANGEWRERQDIAGDRDENSGGTTLLLSPGLRLSAGIRWSGYLSLGIPVLQDLNGIQHETRYRIIAGIGAGF